MDITKLKNLVKSNAKYILIAIVVILSLIGFNVYINKMDNIIAVKLVNNDLLTRSIDEESYIINHKMVFNENKLKENLEYLLKENNINLPVNVTVKENKVYITIGKEELTYEIVNNRYN